MSEMDPVTLGELSRRLDREFADVKRAIEIQNLQYVLRDRYDAERTAIERRVEAMEEREKWRNRFLIGAFIPPVISVVVTAMLVAQ